MYVSRPRLAPRFAFKNLEQFLIQIEGIRKPISGGIAVYGAAAAYALVPEYGWPFKRPGPRTMWGRNAFGQRAIMSKQAPEGYINIHEDEMWPILTEELGKVDFNAKSATELRLRLEVAVDNASQRIARLVSDSAPVDSGDLRAGVQLIDSGDATLDISDISRAEGQVNLFF